MGKRTLGREIALQYLYLVEVVGTHKAPLPEDFLQNFGDFAFTEEGWIPEKSLTQPLDLEIKNFAVQIIQNCLQKWEEFSEKMKTVVQNFSMERTFPVDRAILRIALYEIQERKDIPLKVSMNEAIELGKRFSTEKSGAFINGVLEKLKDLK